MHIAGLVKNSLVDFPGYISAVVFVPGCNMDCWYCHNKHLWKSPDNIELGEIYSFLEKHRGFLDGIVISGGEPTLQEGLKQFIEEVKSRGYRIKLDTNGTKPEIVEELLPMIDYVAMDVKAPEGAIRKVVSYDMDETPIWKTADLLIEKAPDYEFRTTVMPLLDMEDMENIAKRIKGAKRYALQQYRKTENVKLVPEPHSREFLITAAQKARRYIDEVLIRGI